MATPAEGTTGNGNNVIYIPPGNAVKDSKTGQPVWGSQVTIPEHADEPKDKTVEWTRAGSNGTQGNGTQGSGEEGDEGNGKVTQPIVTLPDGTTVAADDYFSAAFAAKTKELDVTQARLDGMIELAKTSVNGNGTTAEGSEGEGETTEEEAPPKFEHMTFSEETETEANERFIQGKYNEVVDALNERETYWKAKFDAQQTEIETNKKNFDELSDVVGREQWKSAMARVTAVTGLSEDVIMAKYRETRIADADVLSSLILGEQAKDAKIKEAEEAAEKARLEGRDAVGGQTQGGGTGTETPTPLRGLNAETDYTPEKLVTKYKLFQAA